jgi:hypothetical protein
LVGKKAFIEPPNRDLLLCVQEGPYEEEEAAFITLRKESIVFVCVCFFIHPFLFFFFLSLGYKEEAKQ